MARRARALIPWAAGALGPALVAFLLTWRATGGEGARSLLRGTLAFRRIGLRWWAAMLGVALLPNAAALAVRTAAVGELPSSVTGANATVVSAVGVLAFAFAAGLVEEPGWRGYALERLQSRTLLGASLVVAAGWSLWHLPFFLIDGTFQNELGFGSDLWWFLLQILPTAVLLAWVYVRTGRLVAAAVALHALGNAAGELVPVEGGGRWLALGFLTALAAAVVVCDRGLFLAGREATIRRRLVEGEGRPAYRRTLAPVGSRLSAAPSRVFPWMLNLLGPSVKAPLGDASRCSAIRPAGTRRARGPHGGQNGLDGRANAQGDPRPVGRAG